MTDVYVLKALNDEICFRGKGRISIDEGHVEIFLPLYTKSMHNFTVQITPIIEDTNTFQIHSFASTEVIGGRFTVFGKCGKFSWLVHAQVT